MDLQNFVAASTKLFSLPEVAIRVNEMVDNPRHSAEDIGNLILHDSAMTARLLKIVNSSFYGLPSRIDAVSRAVTVIGAKHLRDLILTTAAIDAFHKIPRELMDMGVFWQHSVYCGVLARTLATKCNVLHSERLFVAGMLHDIGKPIIYHHLPEAGRDALLIAGNNGEASIEAEYSVMGFSHAEVGAELMRQWNLPMSLVEAAQYHHAPEEAAEFPLEVAIMHLANILANWHERSPPSETNLVSVNPLVWQITSLSPALIPTLVEEAASAFRHAFELIVL